METDQELMRIDSEMTRAMKAVKALKLRKKARLLELGRETKKAPDSK